MKILILCVFVLTHMIDDTQLLIASQKRIFLFLKACCWKCNFPLSVVGWFFDGLSSIIS